MYKLNRKETNNIFILILKKLSIPMNIKYFKPEIKLKHTINILDLDARSKHFYFSVNIF